MSRGPSDPRLAAFRILQEVEAGEFADRVADHHLGAPDSRDRALALELAFGCLRLRARLDIELARLVDRPMDRIDVPVLLWLRLGLYQLRELRVPDHAAVHETVEGARRVLGGSRAGFVNAVLRAAVRVGRSPDLYPSLETDPVGYLSTWGSHPEWIVRRWLDRWPVEKVARLVELDNQTPRIFVRLLNMGTCEEAAASAGPEFRLKPVAGYPRSCELAAGDPGGLLERVDAVVQDPAASAVVDYAGTDPDVPVLDACAAPGGKALALARSSPEARPFVAADVSRRRIRRLVPAAARLGVKLQVVVMDARRPALRRAGTVLLDAPCTGTGVLRRRPDARWRIGPERLESLVRLQREMLDGCASLVTPGGLLVYATCSLESEENEEQVEDFLRRHGDFEREFPVTPGDLPDGALRPSGELRVLPWTAGTDGAFAARLRRRAA